MVDFNRSKFQGGEKKKAEKKNNKHYRMKNADEPPVRSRTDLGTKKISFGVKGKGTWRKRRNCKRWKVIVKGGQKEEEVLKIGGWIGATSPQVPETLHGDGNINV